MMVMPVVALGKVSFAVAGTISIRDDPPAT
jgi:hypothetical protein